MKRLIIPIALVAVLFVFRTHTSTSNSEDSYKNNMKKLSNGAKLDGPDKALYRDLVMTMDPVTGEIRKMNVEQVFRDEKLARTTTASDFQWNQINSELAGRVRSIMIDPNDGDKLWAGSVTGGLWYNPDFRENDAWIPVSDDWESLSIGCITYDPNNTGTYYVGTGESYTSVHIYRESTSSGAGIYKSTDGGASWSLLSSTLGFEYVNDIVVRNESGTSVIYAAVASGQYQGSVFDSTPSDGLYRSTDGGATWDQVMPNIDGSSVPYAISDIELAPEDKLYVGTMRNLANEGAGKIFSSTNGVDWTEESISFDSDIVEEGEQYDFEMYPGRMRLISSDDVVYAVGTAGWVNDFEQIRDHSFFTRLMVKRSGSWSYFEGPGSWASIPWHALAIQVDPNDGDKLVVGGLDLYATADAANIGPLSWIHATDWSAMYHFSDYTRALYYDGLGQAVSDSILKHFVHADIHDIEFGASSDEILVSSDGGVQFSENFSANYEIPTGDRLEEYAEFNHINNSFATTQYYTVALHPSKGNNEVLAGSQDNSTHTSEDGTITYSKMIGGGDGAFCFFDSDDLNLRITSSQFGNYNFWIEGDDEYSDGVGGGTFINPADYDDRSNLIYSNLATDGGFEAYYESLIGRYLDTLAILNVNKFLKKDDLGLDTLTYVKLGTNSTTSFSEVKVSPHSDELDATVFLGNQLGDVYKITGLPYDPVSEKIDNNQLPVGYISSIDIGDTESDLLVTFSNYGVSSVWHTKNGGNDWQDLERNLPDIPVRHGIFNPLDDQKILLATEAGIWGLENILDESAEWVSYNDGLPNVRVDMIEARGSDSVIVAATHGRGLFLGKFSQGELIEEPLEVSKEQVSKSIMYPNPAFDLLHFNFDAERVSIFALDGKLVMTKKVESRNINISELIKGIYHLQAYDAAGKAHAFKLIKK